MTNNLKPPSEHLVEENSKIGMFINDFVQVMGTLFIEPEQPVVRQGERSIAIYFVANGSCYVQ